MSTVFQRNSILKRTSRTKNQWTNKTTHNQLIMFMYSHHVGMIHSACHAWQSF